VAGGPASDPEVSINGILHGTLTITAGFGGLPELPLYFTPPASVPLLGRAALRHRSTGHKSTI